jgi:fructose-1,6-bisphosphatase/inositol monophosphatase family enzyme
MVTLEKNELDELLKLSIAAAREAQKVIVRHRHTPLDVRRKGEGTLSSTVVTEVDVKSQSVIVETLTPALEKFDIALLSEEQPDDGARLEKRAFFCVDPLDGTLPFIEGKPGYAVSIGLVSKAGDPLLGVILDPEAGRLYSAIRGGGAFCGSERISMVMREPDRVLTAVVDRSAIESDQLSEMTQIANQVFRECGFESVDMFNYGGAAMNAMVALRRQPGCYFKFPRKGESGGSLWDYGASACIYREAGAVATDIYGAPLELNRQGSTYMNHRGFIYATDARIGELIQRLCRERGIV